MIRFSCAHCRAELTVHPDYAGREIGCFSCHRDVAVPDPNAPTTLYRPPGQVAPMAIPVPAVRFACPSCRAAIQVAADRAGGKMACPKCGQRLQVPAQPNRTVLGQLLPPAATQAQGDPPEVLPADNALSGQIAFALRILGVLGILWGISMGIKSLIMDTTVPTYDLGRVHNIGLLQEQQMGLILAAVAFLSGLAMLLASFLVGRKR